MGSDINLWCWEDGPEEDDGHHTICTLNAGHPGEHVTTSSVEVIARVREWLGQDGDLDWLEEDA